MSGERSWVGRWAVAGVLYAVVAACVVGHQVHGNGALRSVRALRLELHADAEGPWGLGEELPYRYRPAYRWAVLGVHEALGLDDQEEFFWTFVVAGGISLWAALCALHGLLRALGFSERRCAAGGGLFALGFPVWFGYDMPIHTREDFLGYAWICGTLWFVVKDRPWGVALMGVAGAWIRETCLLGVLPFLWVSERPLWQRLAVYVPGGISLLALRATRGIEGVRYDYLGISTAPTWAYPVEAALYLFACFGALWVVAGRQLWRGGAPERHRLLRPAVVWIALAAVAGTGWTLGMVREARITYILAPWVIALSLHWWEGAERARVVGSGRARAVGLGVALVGVLLWVNLRRDPELYWVLRQDPQVSEDVAEAGPPYWGLGTSFHPGVVPEIPGPGGRPLRYMHASPWNGPVVWAHVTVAAALVAGFGAGAVGREEAA